MRYSRTPVLHRSSNPEFRKVLGGHAQVSEKLQAFANSETMLLSQTRTWCTRTIF